MSRRIQPYLVTRHVRNKSKGSILETYKLSILLVTFNHEAYIHQAMRSILDQIVAGPVELVVADDSSSDRTREIIRSYENADSRFHFKYLDHIPNRGITKNYQRGFTACSGSYVAVMEGDDYWCSPYKLQRQSDFLDAQWQCDLCSVNYFVFEMGRCQFTPRVAIGGGHRFVEARDLIADNLVGNFSTCMYRKTALDALPSGLFDIKSYDWIVNICVARRSLIGFLEEPMSVYRLHACGGWTQLSHIDKLRLQLELIPAYSELTEDVFKVDFDVLTSRLRQAIAKSQMMQVVQVVESATLPVGRVTPRILDLAPPILIVVAKWLLPPFMKRFLVRRLVGIQAT
jgi:glycosyltransferase involved in cell wall biosynthesis